MPEPSRGTARLRDLLGSQFPCAYRARTVLFSQSWFGTVPGLCLPLASSFAACLFAALRRGGDGGKKGLAAGWVPAPCLLQEQLSPAQAALASSLPSPESRSKPQLKQYRKTDKENKTERLLFPRSHTLFVGCSGVEEEHSKGVFAAHPAWDSVREACKLHRVSAQAAGAGPDRANLSCSLLPGQTTAGQSPSTQVKHPLSCTWPQSNGSQQPRLKTTHPIWGYHPLLAGQANVPRSDGSAPIQSQKAGITQIWPKTCMWQLTCSLFYGSWPRTGQ